MGEPTPNETSDDDAAEEPKQEGKKGPAKRFAARLTKAKADDPVDTTPYGVSLKEPKKPPTYLEPAPYHKEDEEVFPPASADCYLQLWELDSFAGAGKYLAKAEGDAGKAQNRLIGAIPGCVVLKGKKFQFRSMGQPVPTRTFHKECGQLTLKLKNTDEEEVELKLNLPEYEGVLELAACLSPTAATATLEEVTDASGVTFVHNVHASVHKQLRDRGGIAVSCIAKYPEPVSNNDIEMERQAKQILGNLATFKVEDGKLRLGLHKIKGYHEIPDLLEEVRTTAQTELKLKTKPKVSTLLLFAHGIRQRLLLNIDGYSKKGSLTAERCSGFVSSIQKHITGPFVIPLFACNNGRGERAWTTEKKERMQGKKDSSYGRALACEIPGYDSLGWHLHTALEQAGIKNTVWAHTTTGHTTRNCRLRVFSSWGVADFASCLYGGRAATKKTIRQYGLQTNYSFKSQKREVAQQKLSNANLIRRISIQSALYLDWSWLPDPPEPTKDKLYNAQAATECQEAVQKYKDLLTLFDVAPEEWSYEDKQTKAHITGKSDECAEKDPAFSRNFKWSELKKLASPFRVSVALIKAAQACLTPTAASATVTQLIENGDGIVLKAKNKKARGKLEEAATTLQGLKLLKTVMPLGKKELLINVSGVRYDSALAYVLGGPAEAYLTRSIKMGDFGESPPAKINRELLLIAQELMDQVKDAQLVGMEATGEVLYLQSSDVGELERLAEELEAGGRLGEASRVGSDTTVKIASEAGAGAAAVAP